MKINRIIPVKHHLAKFIQCKPPRNEVLEFREALKNNANEKDMYKSMFYRYIRTISFSFQLMGYNFGNYHVDTDKLSHAYYNGFLFKKVRKNANINELVNKWPLQKYTYLIFNLELKGKRIDFKADHQSRDIYIQLFNSFLNQVFWDFAIGEILYNDEMPEDYAIDEFYHYFKLTDMDYKRNSFKTMLHKKKNKSDVYNLLDEYMEGQKPEDPKWYVTPWGNIPIKKWNE